MRTAGAGFASMLDDETTTIATLWSIIREDTTEFYFTDHSVDITHLSNTYLAAEGFTASPLDNKSNFSVDSLDIQGFLSASGVAEADVKSGLFDNASIEVKLINYDGNLDVDFMLILKGAIGEIADQKQVFLSETRGLTERIQVQTGAVYSPVCRAILGDAKCGFNMGTNTVQGTPATSTAATVTDVTSRQVFTVDSLSSYPQDDFRSGEVTWVTGNNAGLKMEIKTSADGVLTLMLPMQNTIQVSDTVTVLVGCNKRFQVCIDKFANAVNFRGEPHVPGLDKVLETAGNNSGLSGVTS